MKKIDLFFAFILLPVDIVMIIAAFILAYYVRMDLEVGVAFNNIGLFGYLKYALFLLPIWLILFALNKLYYIKSTISPWLELYRIFSASSTAMLFLIVDIFLTKSDFFSRLVLIFTWVSAVILIFLGRSFIKAVRRVFSRSGFGQINILLIGDTSTTENVVYNIKSMKDSEYEILGMLTNDGGPSKYNLPVLGAYDDLSQKIKSFGIDEVILTDINMSKTKLMNIIQICSDSNIIFKYIPDTFSLMNLNVSPTLIGSMPVMELKSAAIEGWGRIAKRILDIIFSLFLLVVLSPLFLIIAILVKLTSKGPVFYKQERIGRNEESFYCHKFRSMVVGANKQQSWTTQDKSSALLTPIGNFLRKTNLDELPQFWDIFIGKMSFVGPRPEQPKYVKKFESEIPEYFRRHKVKVGLTGWAQVNGLKGDTSISERVRYDMYYIENWTLWFDFKIIIKTAWIVLYEIFKGKYEYSAGPRLDH